MPGDLFLEEDLEEKKLPEYIREEMLILYALGVNIDEIRYLINIKLKKSIGLNKLINFLFSSI